MAMVKCALSFTSYSQKKVKSKKLDLENEGQDEMFESIFIIF